MRDRTTTELDHTGERGFALVEILVAMAILSIGLLGVAGAMTVQSGAVASAVTGGQGAVTHGYYASTAIVLAQDRLEQVKRLQYTIGSPAVDQIAAPIPTGLDDEAFGSIPGYAGFSRQVRVENYPASSLKTVTVTVLFRAPMSTGVNTESVALSTLIAARP
jgi:prepilin-type N-terminal cleavage/methylation domain-containing protein